MDNEAVASGDAGSGGGANEVGPVSGVLSPKSRMKFLCSYGGKILPISADGHLKYVGGETRFVAVPRDITFSELMKKLSSEFEADMVLKYQVIPEDFDVLVSVRTNEDVKHMFDEYDRHGSEGTAKLRAFLFPSNPVILENQNIPADPRVIEQCYIDALNNTVRSFSNLRLPHINANHPSFSISACTSPRGTSPDNIAVDAVPHEPTLMNSCHNRNTRLRMHKVHSSPSLYNLNALHLQTNNHRQHHHQYYQHHQQHHPHGYQSSRLAHEPHCLTPSSSHGCPETGRAPVTPLKKYYSNVHNVGSGNSSKHGNHDDHSPYGCRTTERLESHPSSPKNKILE